jgi:hypothetical protein
MWSPAIAHVFHLKRADALDWTLHEFLDMNEALKERAKAAR